MTKPTFKQGEYEFTNKGGETWTYTLTKEAVAALNKLHASKS